MNVILYIGCGIYDKELKEEEVFRAILMAWGIYDKELKGHQKNTQS